MHISLAWTLLCPKKGQTFKDSANKQDLLGESYYCDLKQVNNYEIDLHWPCLLKKFAA
jgi:hypothetical protein